jgi:DNA-binding response OmpR family regulator
MATILIVEDEPEIRALVQSFIEEQGHKVLSAATADATSTISLRLTEGNRRNGS